MARNKMEDLRDHMFAALERLNDNDITKDKLEEEIAKSKAICQLSGAIVETAKVELEFIEAIGAIGTESQFFKGIHSSNQLT